MTAIEVERESYPPLWRQEPGLLYWLPCVKRPALERGDVFDLKYEGQPVGAATVAAVTWCEACGFWLVFWNAETFRAYH